MRARREAAVGSRGALPRWDCPTFVSREKTVLTAGPARRSAKDNPLNCQQRPLPRGAGAFVPPADLQRSFPLFGASHGGEAAERKARRFRC